MVDELQNMEKKGRRKWKREEMESEDLAMSATKEHLPPSSSSSSSSFSSSSSPLPLPLPLLPLPGSSCML